MKAKTKIDPQFWNRCAVSYAKKPIADEHAYAQTLERVRAHLNQTDNVLELGCGTGTTALRLSLSVEHILATDFADEMIRIAQDKAKAERVTNIDFQVGTLEDSQLAPEHFDAIMTFNFLHLVADLGAALRRIHELLKPGGCFLSKTPCIGASPARHVIPVLQLFGKAPPVLYVKSDALQDEVRAVGFAITETGHYPAKSHNFFIAARKL